MVEFTRGWDGLLAVCGYETRGRAVAETYAANVEKMAILIPPRSEFHAFRENRRLFETLQATAFPSGYQGIYAAITELVLDIPLDRAAKIIVDYSAMDRDVIAEVVDVLAEVSQLRRLSVTFAYSVGDFETALAEDQTFITVNRPALSLGGWSADPYSPLIGVVGLGYESDLALAALESLEPAQTYLFEPLGADGRFDEIVWRRNESLLMENIERVASYSVSQPLSLYRSLMSFAGAMAAEARVVFVPLGPKVFALSAALTALNHPNSASMWRVSPGEARRPRDRRATGEFYSFEVSFHERLALVADS